MSYLRPAGSSDEDDDEFEFSTDYNDESYEKQSYPVEKPDSSEQIFYSALEERDIKTMKSMIDNGYLVDQPLSGGWSSLMHACSLGLFNVIEFLLGEGANVNFNKESFTPLMALCKSASLNEEELEKCLDLLLENGAKINATDRNACTALMYACMSGHSLLVKKLVDCGCDVNIQDVEGWSALFHAVNMGFEDIIHILMKGKARLDLIDKRRRSAFDIAKLKGFEHVEKLVCSKKEKCKLLEIEESVGISNHENNIKDPFIELMNQLPKINAKNKSGFSSDVSSLLFAMRLGHLNKLFEAANVQLNEFLLITDDRLKELGVRFSVHRHHILNSLKKFHLRPWNKTSLGLKQRNQQMDIENGVNLMCNVIKHLHVLDATINYVRLHQPIPIKPEVFKACEKANHQLNLISNELRYLKNFASELKLREKIEPVDLIRPKIKNQKSYFSTVVLTTIVVGIVLWKRHMVYIPKFKIISFS